MTSTEAVLVAVTASLLVGCSEAPGPTSPDLGSATPWLQGPRILVDGVDATTTDCRTGICKHNENTDLVAWRGHLWLVHRTAESQVLGPNSALLVYRSDDNGATFTQAARLPAPAPGTPLGGDKGRDIRDPHFFIVNDQLRIKALARLPVNSLRDSFVDTATLVTTSDDGFTFTPFVEVAPHAWSFWRIRRGPDGAWYSAAYADGDLSVSLFSSSDGERWQQGASIYAVSADTPLETELTFLSSGRLLALVRMDGTNDELLGVKGRLRTRVCWSMPPYSSFDCPQTLDGARLDGPLSLPWHGRLLHIGRKHDVDGQRDGRKRTALFELGGNLEGGPLTLREWGVLPSAGDTAYAGIASLDGEHFTVSWYSGDLEDDDSWLFGVVLATNIWVAQFDPSRLP